MTFMSFIVEASGTYLSVRRSATDFFGAGWLPGLAGDLGDLTVGATGFDLGVAGALLGLFGLAPVFSCPEA